jgi:hypothetical protein
LPRLLANGSRDFDFGLDGCHAWPMVFVDFQYINYLTRPGGFLMLDDVQLYSIRQMVRMLREQPGHEVALDFGKAIVFRKTSAAREIGAWFTQPYITQEP